MDTINTKFAADLEIVSFFELYELKVAAEREAARRRIFAFSKEERYKQAMLLYKFDSRERRTLERAEKARALAVLAGLVELTDQELADLALAAVREDTMRDSGVGLSFHRSMKALQREEEAEERGRVEASKYSSLAVRAFDLFPAPAFQIQTSRGRRDQQLLIGTIESSFDGHRENKEITIWVRYFHEGNFSKTSGEIEFNADSVDRELARRLGISEEQAVERIREFCRDVCEAWERIKLKVKFDCGIRWMIR